MTSLKKRQLQPWQRNGSCWGVLSIQSSSLDGMCHKSYYPHHHHHYYHPALGMGIVYSLRTKTEEKTTTIPTNSFGTKCWTFRRNEKPCLNSVQKKRRHGPTEILHQQPMIFKTQLRSTNYCDNNNNNNNNNKDQVMLTTSNSNMSLMISTRARRRRVLH